MKKLKTILMAAACVAALSLGAGNVAAQRPNFDPAEMKQRIVDGWRERLEVKDDAEWKVLADAIGKVIDTRMEIGFGGFGGGFNRGTRRGGETNNATGGDQNRRRTFGPPPSAEAE